MSAAFVAAAPRTAQHEPTFGPMDSHFTGQAQCPLQFPARPG
jgi:hypothetical protein